MSTNASAHGEEQLNSDEDKTVAKVPYCLQSDECSRNVSEEASCPPELSDSIRAPAASESLPHDPPLSTAQANGASTSVAEVLDAFSGSEETPAAAMTSEGPALSEPLATAAEPSPAQAPPPLPSNAVSELSAPTEPSPEAVESAAGPPEPPQAAPPAAEPADSASQEELANSGFVRVELPPAKAASAHVSDAAHHIKWIKFHGARSPVITQNVNGPCPLLALINVMLLKGKVQLPPALEVITIGQLMDYVGDAILDTIPADLPAQAQPDFEQNMQDAVAILPKLQTGLDVNVKFCGVQEFEYTPECCIFDLLNVRLYHGWLVDPAKPDLRRAVGQCGYNQLVEKIINNKSSDDATLSHEALLAVNFLEMTASQLTPHGLSELTSTMRDGDLAVFFRNNHFSTIYKYQNQLYLLVTDQGFLREPRVVWETLASTDGAGQFVDDSFEPRTPERPLAAASPEQVDQDYLVALSLQEEATRQQAQDLQWEEYKKAELGNGEPLSDAELARRLQEEEERGARVQQEQQQRQAQQPAQPQQQQQQQQRRQSRPDSSTRPPSSRKNCAVM